MCGLLKLPLIKKGRLKTTTTTATLAAAVAAVAHHFRPQIVSPLRASERANEVEMRSTVSAIINRAWRRRQKTVGKEAQEGTAAAAADDWSKESRG